MNRLKELRLQNGYKTQEDLAKVLFVNQTAVSQWERGATLPSSQMLLRLSAIYGESVDYILGRTDQKAEKQPTLITESGPNQNIIKVAGRDGSLVERILTDDQFAAIKLILEQLPEVDDL